MTPIKKQLNRTLFLFAVLVLVSGIYADFAIGGLKLYGYYPYPYVRYVTARSQDPVRAPRITDYDDTNYYLDPSAGDSALGSATGASNLYNLTILGDARCDRVMQLTVPSSGTPTAQIDIKNGGLMTLSSNIEVTGRVYMVGPSASTYVAGKPPSRGKGVHDIAEGIIASNCNYSDVVVIHPDVDEAVKPSTKPYDNTVAGIISKTPSIYIQPGDNRLPLAIVGKVFCKVTGENGPIKIGDLLVTSSVAGHAMKADAEKVLSGMVVGRAMDNFDGKTKEQKTEIRVLVNSR